MRRMATYQFRITEIKYYDQNLYSLDSLKNRILDYDEIYNCLLSINSTFYVLLYDQENKIEIWDIYRTTKLAEIFLDNSVLLVIEKYMSKKNSQNFKKLIENWFHPNCYGGIKAKFELAYAIKCLFTQ